MAQAAGRVSWHGHTAPHIFAPPTALNRIASLSGVSYPFSMGMKGITIKLPETTLRQLRDEASETGRTVAALVRERVETPQDPGEGSVFAITSDLAGSLAGSSRSATNDRRRFRRA